ncbi:HdeD family acid-resistance protein [Staphylococcus haemolyticus]|nr:HdeD family acid-resistance protein [Staphylococcus haemolyticus]
MVQDNGKLKWSSLIMGTLLLIVAVIIFSYPVKNFYTLTWLIGLLILINGVIQLLFRRAARAIAGSGSGLIVVIGIIDIIFGLLVIFNVGASSTFFIFMFATWFIVSSVIGLMTISKQSRLKGLSIIVNVLGLLLGIILLFNPMMGMILVSTMIAITFAILGVTYVIDGLA